VEVEEGDALYFPSYWWHQVTSYDQHIAVNYWWKNPGYA
jgi:ribosomal protein L16 Arg81 hydroxylase